MFSVHGPAFRRLAESQASSTAGDALVTMALAGTLFFQVPATDARDNVALYLLLTLAPFALIGPVLGRVFARFPLAYRAGLGVSAAGRFVVVIGMLFAGLNTLWLYPLAFALLVFSRFHGISRSSLVPTAIPDSVALVDANARLARIGVLAATVAVPVGAPLVAVFGSWPALYLAAAAFAIATWAGLTMPGLDLLGAEFADYVSGGTGEARAGGGGTVPRRVRWARFATAGVRFLNGFLLLLVAFEFRDANRGIFDFGFLLGAAGAGFFIAALTSPWLERRLREEPMVVAAIAVEAAAAFIGAQVFGIPAAAALAAAAGIAWGTAKFGFDGLLQRTVDPEARAATFTSSETLFQLVWVIGALIPTALTIPTEAGLVIAGVIALSMQVLYISALLVPLAAAGREHEESVVALERRNVTEYF